MNDIYLARPMSRADALALSPDDRIARRRAKWRLNRKAAYQRERERDSTDPSAALLGAFKALLMAVNGAQTGNHSAGLRRAAEGLLRAAATLPA